MWTAHCFHYIAGPENCGKSDDLNCCVDYCGFEGFWIQVEAENEAVREGNEQE